MELVSLLGIALAVPVVSGSSSTENPPPSRRPRGFIPSPEHIAAECLAIQTGWSEDERLRRIVGLATVETTETVDLNTYRRVVVRRPLTVATGKVVPQ